MIEARPRPGPWAVAAAFLLLLAAGCRDAAPETTYVCPPCAPHDTLTFDEDGTCPICGMELIEKPDSSWVGHVHLREGSGTFVVEGGRGREGKLVTGFYHRPASFTAESPILLVLPGAGRNAWDYRDAWVDASEEHGVLVVALGYPESVYPFEEYHMGGVVGLSNLSEAVEYREGSAQARLDEDALSVEPKLRPEEWIFPDFDRIFERVAAAVGSERTGYDLFGHSAGGQILHRLVLFRPRSAAERVVAANAGFYTLPDLDPALPFGLAGTPVEKEDLRASFRQRLTLLLGGEDDHREAGGTFLRSPSADVQGSGRLQRGTYFYRAGREMAAELGVEFAWKIDTVPGVAHDHESMTKAAAEYLYGDGG